MNNEQHTLDEIDQLIASELDENGVPLDDYNKDRYVKCDMCQQDWHGTPAGQCPGAWATDEQKQAYEAGEYTYSKSVLRLNVPVLQDGQSARFVAYYEDGAGHTVRGTIVYEANGTVVTAFFTPDRDDDEPEYRYLPTESDDSHERQGLIADLLLYDEANNLNWPEQHTISLQAARWMMP